MAAHKGCIKTGGRKKGTPNKITADIKAAFRLHGDELVKALIKLTKSKDERVRLGAIQTAMDRGFGKPVQHIEAEVSVYDSLSLAEQEALLAALDELADAEALEATEATEPALGEHKLIGNGTAKDGETDS